MAIASVSTPAVVLHTQMNAVLIAESCLAVPTASENEVYLLEGDMRCIAEDERTTGVPCASTDESLP